MTTPDTKAIRAVRKYKLVHSYDYQSQMLVRPDGSWVKQDDYLALCDALDAARAEVKTLRRQAETLKEGWRISDEGRIEAESENEWLRSALRECEGALDLHGKMYPAMVKGYTLDALNAARAALAQKGDQP